MSDAQTEPRVMDALRSHAEIQALLRAEIASLHSLLEERFKELGMLTQQMEAAEAQAAEALEQKLAAVQSRHAVEVQLVHVLYRSWRDGPAHGVPEFAQQIDALSSTDLFDPAWYLDTYPDVSESGMSPKEHYVRSGAFEGRNPGPNFDTMAYYMANRDIAEMGWPALVHYALFGQAEGRPIA